MAVRASDAAFTALAQFCLQQVRRLSLPSCVVKVRGATAMWLAVLMRSSQDLALASSQQHLVDVRHGARLASRRPAAPPPLGRRRRSCRFSAIDSF
jgi:hypothetical protein